MTELEQAAATQDKIRELNDRIKAATDMRDYAIAHKDEIDKQIWSRQIRELRQQRHDLHESCRYVKFETFIQCAKAFLTKEQYEAIWRKVDEVIENPKLMQS
jgi:hypothetical protein